MAIGQAQLNTQVKNNMSSLLEKTLHTRFITDLDELCERLDLPKELSSSLKETTREFSFLIPESVLARVKKGDLNDPILKHFLPSLLELKEEEGFVRDPLCESSAGKKTSDENTLVTENSCILQKYAGRVLIISSNACAAHCRFCFRRNYHGKALFPIPQGFLCDPKEGAGEVYRLRKSGLNAYFDQVFKNIRTNPNVNEVVFSGGDPLTLTNDQLKSLLDYIKTITTVKRVRFHSRVPILVPERIDSDFPSSENFDSPNNNVSPVLYLVVHVNSPNEIDNRVTKSLLDLRKRGYILTSQTTLLSGINDDGDTLVELFEKLTNIGVVPYYLHQLDRVQGAAHFETTVKKGLQLMGQIAERFPGYAVPKAVREIPGRLSKVNLLAEPDADF